MKCPKCKFVFKDPLAVKGGKKSKRALTAEQARAMVAAREAKKKPRAWPEEWLSMAEIKKRYP